MPEDKALIEISLKNMDFSLTKELPIYREERFRTPCELEHQLGLWVDRIGFATTSRAMERLRQLGQYGAVLIEEGQGELIVASHGVSKLAAGDIILLFPDEAAAYNPDQRWAEKWIVWNGPEAEVFEKSGFLKKTSFIIRGKQDIFIEAFNGLQRLMNLQSKAAILDRKIILTQFISAIYGATFNQEQSQEYSKYVESAANFLSNNYNKQMSIDELSGRYGISSSHFRLLFKEYSGMSPRKFITNLRVSAAKKLLMQGLRVKSVAHSTGYDDVYYFIRVFKALTGSSPGTWRKHQKKLHGD